MLFPFNPKNTEADNLSEVGFAPDLVNNRGDNTAARTHNGAILIARLAKEIK
jgi:hypothetical protein